MMKKLYSIWLGMALLFLSASISGQEVKISMDHPDQVNAGEVFEVTVTINKGSLTDYSRFSQDLPLGLTATNLTSPNADFSFDNQRIRIIWLKLPDEPEVKVTYNIMVNKTLKGTFILGGVFAYVVEEERKFLNFEESSAISILPDPSIDQSLVVDIKDFTGAAATAAVAGDAEPEPWAMAVRQKPVLLNSGGYMVRLLLKNPTGSKYAKIEETIPSGYLFESVDPHDGIESFSSSTVKFIWMKLPEEPEFEVAYRLVPKRDEPQGDMVIKGLLTYSAGNENRVVEIKEVDVILENLSLAEKRTLLLSGEIPATAKAQQQPQKTVKEEKVPPKEPVAKAEPGGSSGKIIMNTPVLAAGTGVYYRIQLIAKHEPFDATTHYRQAGLSQKVFVEKHEGLYKYTAGSFTDFDRAKSYRFKLLKLSDSGAFIVAYRDGKRVEVSSTL
ncbi:MAG: hypothetical protein ABFS10_09125 [Bacteroidota bacterium]